MRILVVYPYIPYPLDRGTYHRTYHLLQELAKRHEVTFLALAENGEGTEFRDVFERFCRRVELVSFKHPRWCKLFSGRLFNRLPASVVHWTVPPIADAIDRFGGGLAFDAVHVCDIVMAQYFRSPGFPLIIDRSRVDLQFQLAEHRRMNFSMRTRLLRWEGYAKLWFYERELARRATEIVCGNDDAVFIRRWIRKHADIRVVPNGVDVDYFSPLCVNGTADPDPTALFCGAMDYSANIDALRWFFSEIYEKVRSKIPNIRVLIVGRSPVPEVMAYSKLQGVTVTGAVPDVRPFYERAWVQFVPLRIGGGTRLKILESMAMRTPVLSTSVGAQGLGLEHGREVILADKAAEFSAQMTSLLSNASLRSCLSGAGRKLVERQYGWSSIGTRLDEIYRNSP